MLHKGAKIDAKDNKLQTPFHYACMHGQIVSAYVLMHEGSHITVCNLEEYNALVTSAKIIKHPNTTLVLIAIILFFVAENISFFIH